MSNIQKPDNELADFVNFIQKKGKIESFSRDIRLITLNVAGLYYADNIDEIFPKIKVGDRLDLFREASNEYDKRAILVKFNGEKIGYVMSLSTEQHMSSASFLDVDEIVFEEFMERGGRYIPNEPDRLMIFYNTIDRNRGTTKLWLIGNTITRVCPYLQDWNIQNIVAHMKIGDIKTLIIHNEKNDVKIAIEYAMSNITKSFAIGKSSKMIDSGDWQTEPQPKLPESYSKYKVLYRIGFYYQGFKFLGEYIKSEKEPNPVWFIKPFIKEFDKLLVFSDIISTSKYYQRDIYNLTFKNDRIQRILNNFRESNVFYSDDLTGTDFKNAIDFSIRR